MPVRTASVTQTMLSRWGQVCSRCMKACLTCPSPFPKVVRPYDLLLIVQWTHNEHSRLEASRDRGTSTATFASLELSTGHERCSLPLYVPTSCKRYLTFFQHSLFFGAFQADQLCIQRIRGTSTPVIGSQSTHCSLSPPTSSTSKSIAYSSALKFFFVLKMCLLFTPGLCQFLVYYNGQTWVPLTLKVTQMC